MVLPWSARVVRWLSCPNRTSHSSAKWKIVKSRVTCHRHVSYDIKCAAIGFVTFNPLTYVEWHTPGPDWASRTCAKSELMKSLFLCLSQLWRGATVAYSNGTCPTMLTIGTSSLSRFRQLVWPAVLTKYFLQGFARSHVSRTTCHWSLWDYHHGHSAVPARRTVPPQSRSDQPLVLQCR